MTCADFRESPNSPGAKVDRIVFDFACRYCGAPPGGRCHTKSGAVDPMYHMLRHDDASYAYHNGYRTPATADVPGHPPWPKFKKARQKRKPKIKTGIMTAPTPMFRRMTVA